MDGSTGRRQPPIIMGHEASGIIESVGQNVSGWKAGDRVTFDSTIYQLSDWYSRKGLYNLSDNRIVIGVSCNEFRRMVLLPVMSRFHNISFTRYQITSVLSMPPWLNYCRGVACGKPYRSIAKRFGFISGAGMIALFIIQLLKLSGCNPIMAFDLDQDRLNLALKLGASHVFKADSETLSKK